MAVQGIAASVEYRSLTVVAAINTKVMGWLSATLRFLRLQSVRARWELLEFILLFFCPQSLSFTFSSSSSRTRLISADCASWAAVNLRSSSETCSRRLTSSRRSTSDFAIEIADVRAPAPAISSAAIPLAPSEAHQTPYLLLKRARLGQVADT